MTHETPFLEPNRLRGSLLLRFGSHGHPPIVLIAARFRRALMAVLPETIKMHELRHSAADNLWRETGNIVHAKLHPSMDELTSARPPPIEVFRYALLFTRSLCARSTL